MTSALDIRAVGRRYGAVAAVDGLDLTVESGKLTCLLGPSGCGKSTLLRLIAGLESVDRGEIRAGGALLSGPGTHVPAEARGIGLVFQDQALFPHLSVRDNIGFALRRLPAAERDARVAVEMERVQLGHRAGAHPRALSGGERQRAALARALAPRPAVILLDEPFSGLDGPLKTEVRDTALAALRDAGATVLIVTHDAEEALLMADNLALMHQGRILQTGAPRDCYRRPVSMLAAALLGEINQLPARLDGGLAVTAFGSIPAPGGGGMVMARPEALIIGTTGVEARVVEVRFAGDHMALRLESQGLQVRARVSVEDAPTAGQKVRVRMDAESCAVFPA